jgi:hypothetical protein
LMLIELRLRRTHPLRRNANVCPAPGHDSPSR